MAERRRKGRDEDEEEDEAAKAANVHQCGTARQAELWKLDGCTSCRFLTTVRKERDFRRLDPEKLGSFKLLRS